MCCRQSPQITKLELHSLYIRVCFAYLHLSRLLPWQWGDRACLGVRGFPLQSANNVKHYNDVIIGSMASQKIISFTIVYSAVYSGADQRTHHPPRHWPFAGKSPGTGEFPAQMASNAENVSIWWRHNDAFLCHDVLMFPCSLLLFSFIRFPRTGSCHWNLGMDK